MSRQAAPVAVLPSDGDYAALLPRLLGLAEAGEVVRPGHRVLIKPNLHAPQHWTTGGTTNPALVAALIDWARARGAREVVVGDSPFRGNPRPDETFIRTGMAEAVEAHGAQWRVLTRHGFRRFRHASPHLPRELGISRLALEADCLVDVAVAKTHIDCLVSLGMKNLKGCIRDADKAAFHAELDIDRAIVALARLLRPHLTLVDATCGMEGIGPGAGRPVGLGGLVAGRRTPAVDAVAAEAMGVGIEEARTLRFAREESLLEGGGPGRVVGHDLAGIRRRFERPDEAMAREMPGLRLQAQGACSACKLNVVRALRDNRHAGVPLPRALVVVGNRPPAEPRAICLGQCTRDHWTSHPHLEGCPPSVAAVRQFLAALPPA
ncbi:MAG: DUF362 domain-containing protein [Candidatus Brocadiia bacterium]